MIALRERPAPLGAVPHPAVDLGGDHDLVTVGELGSARPRNSSLDPSEYTLAVSKKLMPASSAAR